MPRLRTSELNGAIEFVAEMDETPADEPFPSELLGRLAKLVPADSALFNERDVASRELIAASGWCADDDGCESDEDDWDDDPSGVDAWEYVVHHPVNVHRRRFGYMGALKDSDFWGRSVRLRHDVFAPEYHAYWGLVDGLSVRLSDSRTQTAVVFLESSDRDFTDRDSAVMDVLRPHLAARHRAARLQRVLADALEALAALPERVETYGVVLVGSRRSVEFASREALRLLQKYFGAAGTRLPAPLLEWSRGAGPRSAFTLRLGGCRLVAESVGRPGSALLLREEHVPTIPLTAREWEVMRWVELGKKNDEISALLSIRPGTVKKHLEHVYAKLGVTTRTAALARLRLRPAPGSEHDARQAAVES